MTLADWSGNLWIIEHQTSSDEIASLRAVVARELADAQVSEISDDNRYGIAYNAALQLSKMALAASGYRLAKGHGGHQRMFEVVKAVIPTDEVSDFYDYFDACRENATILNTMLPA